MRFIVNSQLFAQQLQLMSGVITNNNTIPIINCFYFHLEGNELTIRATDLETTLVSKMVLETAEVDDLADIAVPSKLLMDAVKSLPEAPLTFSTNSETYSVELAWSSGNCSLAGQSTETFPVMPTLSDTQTTVIPSSVLAEAIGKTSFAVSNDELRPQMAGIYMELTPERMTVVATDAHRLVRYRRSDVVSEETTSFILPRKPVTMVKNILGRYKEEVEVTMQYNTTNVSFAFENIYVVCRLVEGKYPNFDAAIPKENPNRLTVDRAAFLSTLRRVALFANQSTRQVRFSIGDRELVIMAEDLEFSTNAKETMPCSFEGQPMEIGFNSSFVIEMLNNLSSDSVRIEMSHPGRAGIIFPDYGEEEPQSNEDILMLVMPVMLNNQ